MPVKIPTLLIAPSAKAMGLDERSEIGVVRGGKDGEGKEEQNNIIHY